MSEKLILSTCNIVILLSTWIIVKTAQCKSDVGLVDIDVVVDVNNTSPAVLDSSVMFQVHLSYENGSLVKDTDSYKYRWKDDATPTKIPVTTLSNSYSKVFSRYQCIEGDYIMNVKVIRSNISVELLDDIVTLTGKTKFLLTETLNVELKTTQNSSGKLNPETFSTHKPILLKARISDDIRIDNTTYSWHVNNASVIAITSTPEYIVTFTEAGYQYVGVDVSAITFYSDPFGTNVSSIKTGLYKDYIILQDSISNVNLTGNTTMNITSLFTGKITCSGSPPFHICWNITNFKDSKVCNNFTISEECNFTVKENLTQIGSYWLYVVVQNDVSQNTSHVKLKVAEPVVVIEPAPLTLVLACIFIAVFMFSIIFYAYRIDSKKRSHSHETADFNFHTIQINIQRTYLRSKNWKWSDFGKKIKSSFKRTKRTPKHEGPIAFSTLRKPSYGSIHGSCEVML